MNAADLVLIGLVLSVAVIGVVVWMAHAGRRPRRARATPRRRGRRGADEEDATEFLTELAFDASAALGRGQRAPRPYVVTDTRASQMSHAEAAQGSASFSTSNHAHGNHADMHADVAHRHDADHGIGATMNDFLEAATHAAGDAVAAVSDSVSDTIAAASDSIRDVDFDIDVD